MVTSHTSSGGEGEGGNQGYLQRISELFQQELKESLSLFVPVLFHRFVPSLSVCLSTLSNTTAVTAMLAFLFLSELEVVL